MDISFFERTRERYLEMANNDESVAIIDAQKIEDVQHSIQQAVRLG